MDACVTWSVHADASTKARAREIAAAVHLPCVPRTEASCRTMVVVEKLGGYVALDGVRHDSHPGMGLVRVRRLRRGDPNERMLEAAEIKEGDRVLDATFGYGQDALVLAHAVGESGRVVALESDPVLTALALAGMRHWAEPGGELSQRIDLRCADHRAFLQEAADDSFDVVLFDPMFRHPKAAAPGFEVVRTRADYGRLEPETLEQAKRVARRRVVVKDSWPGRELERLGLRKLGVRPGRTASFLFGVT